MKAKILFSNALTARANLSGLLTFGVPEVIELAKQYHAAGVELSLRRLTRSRRLAELLEGIENLGWHFPWTWAWWRDSYYNYQASPIANFKGFVMMMTLASARRVMKISQGFPAKTRYRLLHPDAIIRSRPLLGPIPKLCFENTYVIGRNYGVQTALRLARQYNAGLVLDFAHLGLVPEDNASPEEVYRMIKGEIGIERVMAVHLNDARIDPPLEALPLGKGELLWIPEFLDWLGHDGFYEWGYLVPEIIQFDREPKEIVDENLSYLAKLNIEP